MKKYKFVGARNVINASGIAKSVGKSRVWIAQVVNGEISVRKELAEDITKAINENANIEDFFKEDIPNVEGY